MFKKTIVLVLISLVMFLNVIQVSAATNTYSFTKNSKGWTAYNGTWKVVKGEYKQTDNDTKSPVAWDRGTVLSGKKYTDFTIEFKVKMSANGFAGVLLRKAGEKDNHQMSGYLVFLNSDGLGQVYKKEGNVLAEISGGKKNSYNKVKVVVKGKNIKVYLNGSSKPAADVADDEYKSGYLSLVAGNTTASFDDVKITTPK